MAPRPLHLAMALWCHIQCAKAVRRPPPIGSKKSHSYSYLGEKTFKTCMLEELFFFEIHVPKQLQSFDTRMLYSTDNVAIFMSNFFFATQVTLEYESKF